MNRSDRSWMSAYAGEMAASGDPVQDITRRARLLVLRAVESGWSGPPFDIFALADFLRIGVIPNQEIPDARIVPKLGGKFQIEYNPNRSRGRIRYSIAHEVSHTLFPDCAERIRNRATSSSCDRHAREVEMVCNVAAAEILMPIGTFRDLRDQPLSIDCLMDLREKYDVSAEAMLLRAVKLTDRPCLMFCASRDEEARPECYRLDYSVASYTWDSEMARVTALPRGSAVEGCTAIGFTAKGRESWAADQELSVECVGIPGYPGARYPRVAGFATRPAVGIPAPSALSFVKGDATRPRGQDERIVAHIVNDKAPLWGAGFGYCVRKRWPDVQDDFRDWATHKGDEFRLGKTRVSKAEKGVSVFHMISQHGYGPSRTPRIRYDALRACLEDLGRTAQSMKASVHMPRIGCGEAGGSWNIVGELIEECLTRQRIAVTIYDLPARAGKPGPTQERMFE